MLQPNTILTPCNKVLLHNPTIPQLVKQFSTLCGTRSSNTALSRSHHQSCLQPRDIPSTLTRPVFAHHITSSIFTVGSCYNPLNSKDGGPPIFGYQWLLILYIYSYLPYLEAPSAVCNLRTVYPLNIAWILYRIIAGEVCAQWSTWTGGTQTVIATAWCLYWVRSAQHSNRATTPNTL
jgi:hypothetical protein